MKITRGNSLLGSKNPSPSLEYDRLSSIMVHSRTGAHIEGQHHQLLGPLSSARPASIQAIKTLLPNSGRTKSFPHGSILKMFRSPSWILGEQLQRDLATTAPSFARRRRASNLLSKLAGSRSPTNRCLRPHWAAFLFGTRHFLIKLLI